MLTAQWGCTGITAVVVEVKVFSVWTKGGCHLLTIPLASRKTLIYAHLIWLLSGLFKSQIEWRIMLLCSSWGFVVSWSLDSALRWQGSLLHFTKVSTRLVPVFLLWILPRQFNLLLDPGVTWQINLFYPHGPNMSSEHYWPPRSTHFWCIVYVWCSL